MCGTQYLECVLKCFAQTSIFILAAKLSLLEMYTLLHLRHTDNRSEIDHLNRKPLAPTEVASPEMHSTIPVVVLRKETQLLRSQSA